ncbi:uncharacterized protein LOC115443151 [Manduca sexta]|uniref:BHLH domain-containing protein n=1 Tax=Manduca sexta TaxID=7130 RepID=A0A921Z3G0_MANSE|nr:uncharacterized protein LOC115443151 [Manduca sexta]KAG6449582.1 hypothetical protein O3G_MSEX006105 [Manduca sexta]
METGNKRSPTRCREWERQRRYKFNDALTKLGEIVISINKARDLIGSENVQYPKVEIVQKAILCLTDCTHEQTQLKAEILALQVELESVKHKKQYKDASHQVYIEVNKQETETQVAVSTKDASIQVSSGAIRRTKNGKHMKMKILQKTKQNALKEKLVVSNVETNVQNPKIAIKEPKIYPRISLGNEKAPENTIVVLPAAPYIFPQRPLLIPPMPPTIVLVNPNMQSVNRHPVPVIGRNNNGDITKTTMVNILPISAYSRPLSVAKNKKSTVKLKNECAKKVVKRSKTSEKNAKETKVDEANTAKIIDEPNKEDKAANDNNKQSEENKNDKSLKLDENVMEDKQTINNKANENEEQTRSLVNNETKVSKSNEENIKSKLDKVILETPKSKESTVTETGPSTSTTISMITLMKTMSGNDNKDESTKVNKVTEKGTPIDDRDKENKLPTILDTALCDGNVEAGNARLELAEEFLAASPTAAFLMSFPLVSGNRADSPAEEHQPAPQTSKDTNQSSTQRRNELVNQPTQYYEKTDNNELKIKCPNKTASSNTIKQTDQQKYVAQTSNKDSQSKAINTTTSSTSNENPFLNLPMPSLISTNCTTADTTFGLEFDCNINKTLPSQSSSLVSNGNLFYKGDPFSTVKNNIYSSSNITSSHDFNTLGLYPCAMEKYTTKNKSDFTNVEDNIMKMGPSRLTYDIDLGWSHKSFDFVTCTTTSNTFSKDILTTVSAPYSTAYNPFNPDFHVPLVTNSSKKENPTNKPVTFAETFTSFYSQSTNLWAEDVPFYTSNSGTKILPKHQNYLPLEHIQSNINPKNNDTKSYQSKQNVDTGLNTGTKSNASLQMSEKYTKKSSNKMHINWMTSEIRPMQNNCTTVHCEAKDANKITFNHSDQKSSYSNLENASKKQDLESNYFPLAMHNFTTQTAQEDLQIWPPARPLGTTEISIEPPPMNLPTLVGDLALGPHDKKKNLDVINRTLPHSEINNCGNFLSVTQLMNRSTDTMHSRYQPSNVETSKTIPTKENVLHFTNESNRKIMNSRPENNLAQPCYALNEPKLVQPYETNMTHFSHTKAKTNNKPEKNSKSHKNNYSAEALIRGGSCTQKIQDPSGAKFMMTTQKYNDFNATQDSSIAQVSHFPPIIDYSDNGYAGQQFSGTTLYNATTNTISNSFYSNFMPGSSNLMSSNYASGAFTSDYIDYNQSAECNYTNQKYEELKVKNNLTTFHQDKIPSNYKSSRRESATKHKLECSKKESNKKYQSKRAKPNVEGEDWNDPSHLLWQNKVANKRHSNLTSEEIHFPNYVSNQMSTQYQSEFFNSHLMPSNMQSVGHNVDRTLSTFPVTSRANFNLSTIFPEIAMKVQ